MVYRAGSPNGQRALPADAGLSKPPQRRPLLPGPSRGSRFAPPGHPAQGACVCDPSTGDPCPESSRSPRYARHRLTTTPTASADLCLRSGSGARPDGILPTPLGTDEGWLYLAAVKDMDPRDRRLEHGRSSEEFTVRERADDGTPASCLTGRPHTIPVAASNQPTSSGAPLRHLAACRTGVFSQAFR
jgi:hypothetical protein